jgi:hypothetical protein
LKLSTIEKERVRKALREAFSAWHSNPDYSPLTHDECRDMRSSLVSIRTEDIPYVLPQVLEDLLDTHTGRSGNSEYAESVVRFLDVRTTAIDGEFVRDRWGNEVFDRVRAQEEELRSDKYSALTNITAPQAAAICEWLRYARTWADLEWNIDQVDSAASYWKGRSQAGQAK